jgi:exodeoxyribonuclease VII large subunit
MVESGFNPIFQVSEFNEVVNNHLNLLGEVTIEGELSRLDVKNGRLIFASIKDKNSALDIFTMAHLVPNFRTLEPGMLVRVVGTAGVYKGTTKFRLMASSIEPQGNGALQIAFEKLKAQLDAEGLFAPERKRPLPEWPLHIGLVTAKDSSAYYDLVKIMTARMGGLQLNLLPVNVQGREAIPTILKAMEYINTHATEFDVIIMARGGGSLEDLQAFNSEEIARAVFSCKVPIISAIGHEDNWSLTDYVADLRASTPSNAAELVVKDKAAVVSEINSSLQFIKESLNYRIDRIKREVSNTMNIVQHYSVRYHQQVDHMVTLIKEKIILKHALLKQEINQLERLLKSLDYQQILNRGFSITTTNGAVVKAASDVKPGDQLVTQLAQGIIHSHVQE